MNAAKKNTPISDPTAADVARFVSAAPKTPAKPAEAEPTKRLTVDIAESLHKAMHYAKLETGLELRQLVAEALTAHPEIAKHLPKKTR